MKKRRAIVAAASFVIGILPAALLIAPRSSYPLRGVALQSGAWPYCLPDAVPPSPSAKLDSADLPAGDGVFFTPSGPLFARLTVPLSIKDGVSIRLSVPAQDVVVASDPMAGGSVTLDVPSDLVRAINGAIGDGHTVVVGTDAQWPDGAFAATFAVDEKTGTVLAPAWGSVEPAQTFIRHTLADGTSVEDLVVTWNAEGEAGDAVRDAWTAYLHDALGVPQTPAAGTMEFWSAAPWECRSYADAPPEIIAGLRQVSLDARVPKDGFPTDAALCVRAESGGMGCSALDASDDGIVRLDVILTGEPIDVQVALLEGGLPSWLNRKTIATLPADRVVAMVEEGTALDLTDTLSVSTYTDVVSTG